MCICVYMYVHVSVHTGVSVRSVCQSAGGQGVRSPEGTLGLGGPQPWAAALGAFRSLAAGRRCPQAPMASGRRSQRFSHWSEGVPWRRPEHREGPSALKEPLLWSWAGAGAVAGAPQLPRPGWVWGDGGLPGTQCPRGWGEALRSDLGSGSRATRGSAWGRRPGLLTAQIKCRVGGGEASGRALQAEGARDHAGSSGSSEAGA